MGLDQFNQSPQNVKNLRKVTASDCSFRSITFSHSPQTLELCVKETEILSPHTHLSPSTTGPRMDGPGADQEHTELGRQHTPSCPLTTRSLPDSLQSQHG
jgi:hypothetical protein